MADVKNSVFSVATHPTVQQRTRPVDNKRSDSPDPYGRKSLSPSQSPDRTKGGEANGAFSPVQSAFGNAQRDSAPLQLRAPEAKPRGSATAGAAAQGKVPQKDFYKRTPAQEPVKSKALDDISPKQQRANIESVRASLFRSDSSLTSTLERLGADLMSDTVFKEGYQGQLMESLSGLFMERQGLTENTPPDVVADFQKRVFEMVHKVSHGTTTLEDGDNLPAEQKELSGKISKLAFRIKMGRVRDPQEVTDTLAGKAFVHKSKTISPEEVRINLASADSRLRLILNDLGSSLTSGDVFKEGRQGQLMESLSDLVKERQGLTAKETSLEVSEDFEERVDSAFFDSSHALEPSPNVAARQEALGRKLQEVAARLGERTVRGPQDFNEVLDTLDACRTIQADEGFVPGSPTKLTPDNPDSHRPQPEVQEDATHPVRHTPSPHAGQTQSPADSSSLSPRGLRQRMRDLKSSLGSAISKLPQRSWLPHVQRLSQHVGEWRTGLETAIDRRVSQDPSLYKQAKEIKDELHHTVSQAKNAAVAGLPTLFEKSFAVAQLILRVQDLFMKRNRSPGTAP